jgi:GTP pyrophosphokinase
MKNYKNFIEYIQKVADEIGLNQYIAAIDEFSNHDTSVQIYPGIHNEDLLEGIKTILKANLNAQATVFTAATLTYTHHFNELPANLTKTYSEEIQRILEGIRKVRNVQHAKALEQADMQRKLILSLSRDTRSILILLAESHFLLRNYEQILNFEQRQEILTGSITVYIPIAHRLGFYKMKSEMEDLVLSIQNPEIYDSIKSKLADSEKERNKIINKFIAPLIMEMNAQQLPYKIKSRLKSVNSIYQKMLNQGVPFEKVYDLWAIRIILDAEPEREKEVIWHTYSIVTNIYEQSLSRLRDWITIPKSSGYESLHVTVKDEDGRWSEVQIRSTRMDEEAENGMAAHWRYKGGKQAQGIDFWLSEIRRAINDETNPNEQSQLQPEKFSNEVFVFTPGGELKKLSYGATVLDFAYSIHSEVGNKCTNAKVNGKIVPIKHVLKNGDQVEIITSKNQKPSIDWLKWVVSTRTKNKIRKALDEQKNLEVKRGKEILERRFKNWKIDLNQETVDKLINLLKLKEHNDLYINVSLEKIDPLILKKLLTGEEETPVERDLESQVHNIEEEEIESKHKDILIIDKIDNINYKLAKCCNPIQGDKIFGFVTVTSGISIHRHSCPNAVEMKKRYGYRMIEARWKSGGKKVNFKTGISLLGTDELGLANKITQVISNEMRVNILSINFISKNGLFEGKVGLLIHDSDHLDALIEKLKGIGGISQVFRHDH